MKKFLLFIFFSLFSFSAIHAEIDWELSDDGTLTISGSEKMKDYVLSSPAPWYNDRKKIKRVVIKDGVTSIGDRAFYGCSNITSVTIPNSVTSIGDYAFRDCSITSVTIPNSVTSIGNCAFEYCIGLTSITIPNSVKSIGHRAFYYCLGLTSVTIGNSVTSIGESAFEYCNGLTSITIPNSVTSIGNCAFYCCDKLVSLTIGNSVKSIGAQAFNNLGHPHLTSMTITFKGSTPPEFVRDVFYPDEPAHVYVPDNSIDAYKNALKGFRFLNIQAIPPVILSDDEAYTQDSQVEDVDVSYTRNFTNTNWQALYLPFSLKYDDWKDDFEVARINGIHQYDKNYDGRIDKTELEFVKMTDDESVIYPNTPYLIKAKKAGEKTLSVENTTVYKADVNQIECSTTTEKFSFRGNYKRIISSIIETKGYYVMENGQLNNKPVYSLGPYRWYMKRENRDSAYGINNNNTSKEISIRVVGEETTGIANIQLTSPNTQTYDLNGRRVNENNLKPGMYVKNGRKFVVK